MQESELHTLVRKTSFFAPVCYDLPPDSRYFEQFAALEDDDPVHVNQSWSPTPDQIVATDPEGLRKILQATVDVGLELPGDIDDMVQYHREHGEATALVSPSTTSLYVAEYYRYGESAADEDGTPRFWTAFHIAPDLRTTKLGLAAIAVYPRDIEDLAYDETPLQPLAGNLLHVRQMGYESVAQIGELIIAHNIRHSDSPLPVPLSLGISS